MGDDSRPLYEALGVSPSADQDAIKQAWRELARALHPDRNPGDPVAAARFRVVRAAWEVLGDPKRRTLYDEFGEDATSAFFDPDLARAAQAEDEPAFRLWGEDARTPTRKVYAVTRGEDHRATLHLSAEEARQGGLFGLWVREPRVCSSCGGTGWRRSMRACSKCETGKIPGIGPFSVPIPAGVVDGQQFVARGEGAKGRGQGAPPGDLWVRCQVPPTYLHRGSDTALGLHVPTGLLREGGRVRVPLPEGGAIRMTIPAGSRAGRELRIRGRGRGGGHLFVVLHELPRPSEVWATKVSLGG